MSHPPTPSRGSRPGDAERELDLLFGGGDGLGPREADAPGRELAKPGGAGGEWPGVDLDDVSRSEETARRLNRLGMAVRGLGTASIALGVVSAAFIWPRVRLIWLAACTVSAIASALAGLGLRSRHHALLRRLAGDLRSYRPLYRTQSHRCRAGLALGVLMFVAGLAILQVEPRPGAEAPPSPVPDAQASRPTTVPPGQSHRSGDLSVRVDSAAVRRAGEGPAAMLEVVLEARNVGSTQKLALDPFRDVEVPLSRGMLHDDLANSYEALERPTIVPRPESPAPLALYPGDDLRVRMRFERPVRKARLLRFLLPTGSFGLPKPIVVEVDAAALGSEPAGG